MLPGEQYHVFNHANGYENIFIEQKNYFFFLLKEMYLTESGNLSDISITKSIKINITIADNPIKDPKHNIVGAFS